MIAVRTLLLSDQTVIQTVGDKDGAKTRRQ
jgi:hypothetical protein